MSFYPYCPNPICYDHCFDDVADDYMGGTLTCPSCGRDFDTKREGNEFTNTPRPTTITRDELLAALAVAEAEPDAERAHITADSLLCQYINDPEIEAAFVNVWRWYS